MNDANDHAQVRIAAPFIYGGFLLLSLILHVTLPLPTPSLAWIAWLGALMAVCGLILGLLAVVRMRRESTTISPHSPVLALVIEGPFGLSRNPIYLGFLLIFLGSTLSAGTWWGLLLTPFLLIAVNRLVIRPEEAYLERRFARQYAEYRSRVKRWI